MHFNKQKNYREHNFNQTLLDVFSTWGREQLEIKDLGAINCKAMNEHPA